MGLGRILLAGMLAIWAGTAAAEGRQSGTFDIRLRGVKAGELAFVGDVSNGRYSAAGRVESTGLLAFVRKVRYDAKSSGNSTKRGFRPSRYVEFTNTGKRVSESEVRYVNGVPQVARYAPPRAPSETDVDPSTQGGTLDPMTALFHALSDLPRTDVCTLNVRMFDGRRASRIQMSEAGSNGKSITCRGAYVRVAGFSEEDLQERRVFPFAMIYAPIGNGNWRVIRVESETLYGRARMIRQ